MYTLLCDDCNVMFENEDPECGYCDQCWSVREKIEEKLDEEEKCNCLYGCDYCLAIEPRIGRD